MKPYRTLATIRLFTGTIGLTDDQVKWRANCLSKISDNVYEVTDEVVFKAGETIGLEDPPKPYRKKLECLEPDPELVAEPVNEKVAAPEVSPTKKRGRKPRK